MKKSLQTKLILTLALSAIVWSCQEAEAPNMELSTQDLVNYNSQIIEGEFIVRLQPTSLNFRKGNDYQANQAAMRKYSHDLLAQYKIAASNVRFTYSAAIDGFSVHLEPAQYEAIKNDPRIISIEPDEIIALGKPDSPGKGGGGGGNTNKGPKNKDPEPTPEPTPDPTPDPSPDPEPDPNPGTDYEPEISDPNQEVPWGINRVGGFSTYRGTNVAFVIDTGIDLDHPDLNVNASLGFKAVPDEVSTTLDDEHSHGTHVAGTIAAINNTFGVVGVAAGAQVVPIKVLGPTGSGQKSWVIAGIDYVAAVGKPGDVANLSLGGSASSTQDQAVLNAAAKGIYFAIAAGNSAADANNYSPARVNGTNIFTISSMDSNGALSSFSNYGNPPIDYAAPGRGVKSTVPGGGYASKSGTSMATPHVAGILLLNGIRSNGFVIGDKDSTADPIAFRADR
ncbi:S8 family serine peptidase [Algoriphagus algorifonticola]|uniref:S8 family serine peptidase n=1 Tax=Algoriphagus algorifonticola TaxID=2593007 RepID=UPI002022E432|nr:S8 family serine peptidase [Algoriphagus algorifonticola]